VKRAVRISSEFWKVRVWTLWRDWRRPKQKKRLHTE
jgi:hypothetical protein